LAENWTLVCGEHTPSGLSSPSELRRWFNEEQAGTPPAPELAIESPVRLTASIEQVAPVAAKVNKLATMAERGEGQEQATAKKYLAKKARDMGAPHPLGAPNFNVLNYIPCTLLTQKCAWKSNQKIPRRLFSRGLHLMPP
jgi:hypothetical protein